MTVNPYGSFVPGSSSAILPLQVPAGATAVYSTIRSSTWSGACLRVQRLSDNAQIDIGFVNNIADWATADTFAGSNQLIIVKIYDQSGNFNTLLPANTNNPTFKPGSNFNSIRPFGYFQPAPGASSNMICPVTMNANSFTVYQVFTNYTGSKDAAFFSFQDTPANGSEPVVSYIPSSSPYQASLTIPGGGGTIGFIPKVAPLYLSCSSNGLVNFNGVLTNLGAAGSATLGQFCLGGSNVTAPYWFNGGMFFTAVYATPHSAATQAVNNASFIAPLLDTVKVNKQICYDGSSLVSSTNSTWGYDLPHQVGFGRATADNSLGLFLWPALDDWQCWNVGTAGRNLSAEISGAPTEYSNTLGVLPSGFLKNIMVIDAPSNDIASSGGYASTAAAQTAMGTLWTGSVLPFVTSLLTSGFTGVVVPTCIPRTGFALGSGNFFEDARVYYNNLVRTSTAGNGYTVSDRCLPGPFSTQTSYSNTVYYAADAIHCTNLGYGIIATQDRAAILSL